MNGSPAHRAHRSDPNVAVLAGQLREHAAGVLADIAAVDLLIGQRTWLSRPDFGRHIHHQPCPAAASNHRSGPAPTDTPDPHLPPWSNAWIDWPAALTALTGGQLPCTGSEAAVLRIAAALGADLPVCLRQVLVGLDRPTIALITTAITRANGA